MGFQPLHHGHQTHTTDEWASLFAEGFEHGSEATTLSCPMCEGLEFSHIATFQRYDLDRRHKCGFCRKLHPIRKWKCPCSKPLHACSTHAGCFKPRAGGEEQLLNGRLSSASSNLKPHGHRKTKVPDEVFAADRRRAKALKLTKKGEKRKADIVFEEARCFKQPTRLGPILTERFGGVRAFACTK